MFKLFKYPYAYAVEVKDKKPIVYQRFFDTNAAGTAFGGILGIILGFISFVATPIIAYHTIDDTALVGWLGIFAGVFVGLQVFLNCVKYIGYKYNNFDPDPLRDSRDIAIVNKNVDDELEKMIAGMIKGVKTNENNVRVLSYKNAMKVSEYLYNKKVKPVDDDFESFINSKLCDADNVQ